MATNHLFNIVNVRIYRTIYCMKFFLKELAAKIFEGNTEECDFARQLLHVLQEKLEDPRMDVYIYNVKGNKGWMFAKELALKFSLNH
ncbi:MAG TPA: hypothetical protein VE521_06840 [Nitrososphaera sp.]|nr:hypothetical protein [Nitrososphaera sp.]